MSKEEFLKIQTCVLKVHIHCDGCKHKVKKILQKIDGVYKFNIDSEQGKVTVSGNVDPATLIKKLTKHGKHAEVWGAPKQNNNQQIVNQFKDMQIGGKGANQNNKGQKGGVGGGGGGGNLQQQGKGGGGGGGGINQLPPQLQQQMKGFQDLKLPQMKGLSMPLNSNGNKGGGQDQKSLKFKVPEEDEFDDDDDDDLEDDFDDDFDDDGDYSDEEDYSDDEFDDAPPSKMKPPGIGIGGGGSIGQMPNMANMANMMKNGGQVPNMPNMMKNGQLPNMMMNGQHPMLMKGGVGGGGGSGANGKNGGAGGGMPVQMNMGCGNSNGKKGGGGGNQNQVGDGGGQKGGKNGGGQPQEGKHGGGQNKNNGGGNIINGNGGKKGSPMNDEFQGMPKMMGGMNAGGGSGGGPVTNMSMGHMGQMGQMGNGPMGQVSAVQGLPAPMSGGGGGNPGGYFQGGGPQTMPGNPYYQQQLSTGMMNQPRAIAVGNDRFQPMMYARPPPETNYMPLYHPYGPYPPPPTHHDPYSNYFDDENTSSCSVM